MTNSEQAIREFAEKMMRMYGRWWTPDTRVDEFLSDLTAFIEEHYVSKEEHEAEKKRLLHCGSCGKPLSRDCPECKHLWES